jgi:hypothetical protein
LHERVPSSHAEIPISIYQNILSKRPAKELSKLCNALLL